MKRWGLVLLWMSGQPANEIFRPSLLRPVPSGAEFGIALYNSFEYTQAILQRKFLDSNILDPKRLDP